MDSRRLEKSSYRYHQKCFRLSGILDNNFELRSSDALQNGEDPSEDCDIVNDDTDLTDLISRVQVENSCSVEELIHGEVVIPVCGELTGGSWDEAFFSELTKANI